MQNKIEAMCVGRRMRALILYLAHSSLDDCIKTSLWGISVPGHHLLLHLLREAAHFLRQGQHMFVAKLGQASGINAVNSTKNCYQSLHELLSH